jgi:DNA-binding SARP family transcriptional activator/Tfp pilus assembly protein PilF
MTLRITLLGPPEIVVDGRPLVVDTRKATALLAFVAVVARPVARESLVDLLWPESDPDGGRGALRRTLSVLRSGLGGPWLEVDRTQVALAASDVTVDVVDFRAALRSIEHRHGPGEACDPCRDRLRTAVELHRGPFLEGFGLRDSAAFDEWQSLEAQALAEELAGALRRLTDLESAAGDRGQAIATARRSLALDPLDEGAYRALMQFHAADGDRSAVARLYRDCGRVLESELGVAPSEDTRALHEALMAAGPPGMPARRADRTGATDGMADLLDAAAIVGPAIDPDLAGAVASRSEDEVASGFETLVQQGVLHETEGHRQSPTEGAVYRFPDEGDGQAILRAMGLARRRVLHRRAAAFLQRRRDEAGPEAVDPGELAAHLAAGGRPTEAAALYRVAGDAARRVARHDEAAERYRDALALGHPDRAAVYEALGDVETLGGRYGQALAAYEAGAALAGPRELVGFERKLGSLHLRRGALDLAEMHLNAALARAGDEPSAARARILAEQALVGIRRGRTTAAGRLAEEALGAARSTGDVDAEAQAENLLAMLARRRGDLDGARGHLRRSLERAGLADDPGARIAALNSLALLERAVGDLEGALELLDEAIRRCANLGDRHREAALRNNRADLLHALGRPREAAEELTRSVTAFAGVGERPGLEPEIWKLVEW